MNVIHRHYLNKVGIPVVGAIVDCTHIAIQSPGGPNSELFRNRKGVFSVNVQVICDHDLNFLNIVTRWPGSTHDARIWRNSRICAEYEQGLPYRTLIKRI